MADGEGGLSVLSQRSGTFWVALGALDAPSGSPQAGLGCLHAAGRGWWIQADPASCFTPLVPGPIQVEELGCLEVEAEAKTEYFRAVVSSQPPALVSGMPAQGAGRQGFPRALK